MPKDDSRNSWKTRTREFFDGKAECRVTTTSFILSAREARIAILRDGGILRIEASPPKLV